MSDDGQRRGNAFAPMHWNAQFTGLGVADAVVNPATDPVSGQPELKHTPVSIRPFATGWQALVLARPDLGAAPSDYWARARGGGFWRYHLAGAEAPASWDDWARTWLGLPDVEWGVFRDPASGRYRFAAYEGNRLMAFLVISESKADVAADWIGDLFRKESVDALSRIAILAGRQPTGTRAAGATVCACLSVGKNQIEAVVRSGKCRSVEAIGQATGAGTNCGSCKPELAAILAACGGELVPGE
jgi:assimilatory nitrate reductase catalytic subunit